MHPVTATVLRLARKHCPIVLLTHSPWDEKQRRATGTVTLTSNFVSSLHYKKETNPKTGQTLAHVLLDSKAGAGESDLHLKLETEGEPHEPGSGLRISYGGTGLPKGMGRAAVIAAIEADPDATNR
jgi:hypothetical protein